MNSTHLRHHLSGSAYHSALRRVHLSGAAKPGRTSLRGCARCARGVRVRRVFSAWAIVALVFSMAPAWRSPRACIFDRFACMVSRIANAGRRQDIWRGVCCNDSRRKRWRYRAASTFSNEVCCLAKHQPHGSKHRALTLVRRGAGARFSRLRLRLALMKCFDQTGSVMANCSLDARMAAFVVKRAATGAGKALLSVAIKAHRRVALRHFSWRSPQRSARAGRARGTVCMLLGNIVSFLSSRGGGGGGGVGGYLKRIARNGDGRQAAENMGWLALAASSWGKNQSVFGCAKRAG